MVSGNWHRIGAMSIHRDTAKGQPLKSALLMLVQNLSKDARKATLYRQRMENVDKWMDQRHLPKKLRRQISKYYAEVGLSWLCVSFCLHLQHFA